jgi:hypothetical protein
MKNIENFRSVVMSEFLESAPCSHEHEILTEQELKKYYTDPDVTLPSNDMEEMES